MIEFDTRSPLNRLRQRCEETAARVCADALAARRAASDRACTLGAIALLWTNDEKRARGESMQHSYVGKFFDPNSGAAITLRDVLALPRELARDVLLRALASLENGEGPAVEETLGDLAIKLGEATSAVKRDRADDGKINDHATHEANFAVAAQIALRGMLAAQKRGGAR